MGLPLFDSRSLVALFVLVGCGRTTTYSYIPDSGLSAVDADGDGYTPLDGDCDDENPEIHPDADELCDGINNDCDGGIDEDAVDAQLLYMDGDGDGYGNDDATIMACGRPPGFIERGDDCDDDAATTYPGAEEICNDAIDNNCNGDVTECVLSGTIPLAGATARILGEAPGDRLGTRLAPAGDTNGDGLADFMLASPRNDNRGNDSGSVYLFTGPVEGQLNAADAPGRLRAISAGHQVGTSIAPAGDIDGDGYDDVLVGAPRSNAGGTDSGEVYLVHGPITGDVTLTAAGLRLIGEISYDVAGTSVSGAGDVTGDGVADLLVGATGYGDGGFQNRGAAYLISGAAVGTTDLSSAEARIMGEARYDRIGTTVLGPGDVNGDGVSDLVTTGYTWPSNDNIGAAFLFFGPLDGIVNALDADATFEGPAEDAQAGTAVAAGDLNNDGHADLVVSAPYVDVTDDEEGAVYIVYGPLTDDVDLVDAGGVVTGVTRRDRIGDSVDVGGDVNRDGIGDLIIGAAQADTDEVDAGAAWMFLGPIEGTTNTDAAAVTLTAEAGRDAAGTGAVFAGDTNGDGLADLLVGATNHDGGGTDAGAAYLVIGTSW